MLSRFWWGWVFLVNLPVVAIGLVVGAALIPQSRASERHDLDLVGATSSTTGLAVLTLGLIQAGRNGWDKPSALALIAGGVAVLGAFAIWERRLDRRGRQPMIDVKLFRTRYFSWGAALSGVAALGMIQKSAGPLGTAIMGSIVAAAYQARLGLGELVGLLPTLLCFPSNRAKNLHAGTQNRPPVRHLADRQSLG
jgi:hypothetical protein